jgi:PAS domain S-box-containing protein
MDGMSVRAASHRARAELERIRDPRFSLLGSAVLGAIVGVVAILGKALLHATVGDPGYIELMAALIIAAWFGGIPAGLSAMAVTLWLNTWFFVEPVGQLGVFDRAETTKQAVYVAVAIGMVLLIASRRAARDRLVRALAESAELAQAVESRDERLELILESSGTGFWEWDLPSGALLWSEAIFRQHGLDPAGPAPDFEAYLELVHPDDRAQFRSRLDTATVGGPDLDMEFRVIWPDGSVHWTHGVGRMFADDAGRPVRMVGTGQDVTRRRRVEDDRDRLLAEERRAGEYREAFIDVISHELRTPITTIMGLSEILARPGRDDEPQARAALLEDIRAESERLHRLVEDLLVLSRVERGRLDIESEPLQLGRLLRQVVAAEAMERPSIIIELDVEPDLPIVASEATYVGQILRNLLGNAAKYSPAGTRVMVSARTEDSRVAIRVSDEGPGISEEVAQRAFDLFYRAPESAGVVAGSGIGLFVCASLVRAMGGEIWARHRPEGGSEFGFLLRVLEPDDDLLVAEPHAREERAMTPPTKRGGS